MVELGQLVELSNHRVVELPTRRMMEWWSCRIVESSNGGMMELVELSNRRVGVVELWNRLMVELVALSNGGVI